jgi:hypothetical protein
VGLVCRVLEEAGIATVCVATGRDLIAQVKPPRSMFVNHPMGNNFGKPFDVPMQTDILRRSLKLIYDADEGGVLVDYPSEWPEPFEYFRSLAND